MNELEKARKIALTTARAQGCMCEPTIEFNQSDHPMRAASIARGLPEALTPTIRHDDWCPLLRRMRERPSRLDQVTFAVGIDRDE